MPAFLNRFDDVIGNPPWVNWESLPATYFECTDALWREAGLFVHSGMAAMLGAGKKDVAMLMSYVVSERALARLRRPTWLRHLQRQCSDGRRRPRLPSFPVR